MFTDTNTTHDHTIKETAVILHTTPHIVRHLVKEKKLKSYQLSPRNTRITDLSIDDFRKNGGAI
jgi:hypothetical protein